MRREICILHGERRRERDESRPLRSADDYGPIIPQGGEEWIGVVLFVLFVVVLVVEEVVAFRERGARGGIVVDGHAGGAGEEAVFQIDEHHFGFRFDVLFHFVFNV